MREGVKNGCEINRLVCNTFSLSTSLQNPNGSFWILSIKNPAVGYHRENNFVEGAIKEAIRSYDVQ